MPTSKSAWKQRERDAAGFWGTLRQRCSGSSGRTDCSRSDTLHDRLFIETKLRERHQTRTLYDETERLAKAEDRLPVLMLADKNKRGLLVVVHTNHFDEVLVERLRTLGLDDLADQFIEYLETSS